MYMKKVLSVLKRNFPKCSAQGYTTVLRNSSRLCKASFNMPVESLESCDMQNGMRLVCDYKKSLITTVGCFLPAGAIYEKLKERGSALFLERLLFKSTIEKYQCQIENKIAEVGGKLTATAMRDMFLFYGTVPSCTTELLVEIFAHVISNGLICEEDVMLERCVILNHLSKMEMDYEQVIMDYLQDIAYQDTELGRSIYPETDIIKHIPAKHVACFKQRLFKPCFMTMVSSGDLRLPELYELVCKHFGGSYQKCNPLPGPCEPKIVECTDFRYSGSDLRLRDDDEELGFVALGVEGPGYIDREDHCALTVAKEIVGSWNMTYGGANHNAPYLAHCAFNSNMCYLYKSFSLDWTTTSIWGCYFVCDKMKLDDMVYMLQKEWMRLCTTITQKEVDRAVNQCVTNELLKFYEPLEHFHDIIYSLHRGGYYESCEERLDRYKKISVDAIRDAASEYIYDQCPAVVGLGRIENLTDYVNICNGMKLLQY